MRYIILISLLLAVAVNSLYAKTKLDPTAKVIVSFDDALLKNKNITAEISVFSYYHVTASDLYDEKYKWNGETKEIEVVFPLLQDISLVKIEVFNDGELLLSLFPHRLFLIEPDDSLSFYVSDKVQANGVDNEKNRLRERISNLDRSGGDSWLGHYIQIGDIDKYYAVTNDFFDALIERKLDVLEKNRDKISNSSYFYIKEECVFSTESIRIKRLQGAVETGAPYQDVLKKHVLQQYYSAISKTKYHMGKSPSYTDYVIDVLTAGFLIPEYVEHPKSAPIIDLNLILNRFQKMNLDQENRDNITAFLFSRYGTAAIGGEQAINKALKYVSDDRIKSYLKKIKESRYVKNDVYPFRLEDIDGNIYTPESFKDKIVVLDFWFNGCTGCAILHQELVKIESSLNDESVLFISVNVDVKRDKWLRGLESGKYTSKEGINLRVIDPKPNIASFYGFFSFPQLLIVDRKGRLVSYNPPRPINVTGRKGFTEMLLGLKSK
ncbi:TlpA family protein disulfide reductase [Sphingobacterium faecale]|uniref:TlpA family protein disulfide reductase n=1 Tax=Sphingobacterium faecale TaxID=2803775 RepID=A0ABS1QYK0_9SPHI|nr:TlpA disulfide reductase family protein [Sphingobacterium faecale]MBL1407510.1 TlpA family protein disulfide reductase [Sphingobacterium faecale]